MKPVEKRKATGKLAELIKEFNDLPCDEKINKICETRVKMEKEVWLDKMCEWIRTNIYYYTYNDPVYEEYIDGDKFAEDIRKAMEE